MSNQDHSSRPGQLVRKLVADIAHKHESPTLHGGPLGSVVSRLNRKRYKHRFAVFFTCDELDLLNYVLRDIIRHTARQKIGEPCATHVSTSSL